MAETIDCGTVDEARQIAAGRSGRILVLSREVFAQIQAAEDAGGFEGGMSGNAGGAGYSAPGGGGVDHSDGGVPGELLDMTGAARVGAFLDGVVETALDIRDVWEAFRGHVVGPVILVPKREMDRWLGQNGPDA